MIKQHHEYSEQRAAVWSHVVEILFCTGWKLQPSASLRNEIFEHVWQFAGNITFCRAGLAACQLFACRLGGDGWAGWAGLRSIVINHCNNVILARVSILKSHVHVCNDFSWEFLGCEWSLHMECAVMPWPGCFCVLMFSGLGHLGTRNGILYY